MENSIQCDNVNGLDVGRIQAGSLNRVFETAGTGSMCFIEVAWNSFLVTFPTTLHSIIMYHMGVSENSVPLNPMVNDQYPY